MRKLSKRNPFKLSTATLMLTAAITSSAFGDTGSLNVTVTDPAGNPIPGVMVQANTPESLTRKSASPITRAK